MSAAIPVPLRSPRDGATQPAEIVALDLQRRAERQAIDDVAAARLTLGRIDDLMAAEEDFAGMLDRAAFSEALEILRGVVALTRNAASSLSAAGHTLGTAADFRQSRGSRMSRALVLLPALAIGAAIAAIGLIVVLLAIPFSRTTRELLAEIGGIAEPNP